MAGSLIDMLARPRVFARFAASASAASARALADGHPVGVWGECGLERLHPNGEREALEPDDDDEAAARDD